MKTKFLLFCLLLLPPQMAGAADSTSVRIKFGGFVKFDAYYDTRRILSTREDDVALYPLPRSEDAAGQDINDAPRLHMLAVFSRMQAELQGPDAFGGKASGLIETDFMGVGNETVNLARLRQIYLQLDFKRQTFIFGQKFHPFYALECIPLTVGTSYGMLFHPLARSPQIRFNQKIGRRSQLYLAALAQRDFSSSGPASDGSAVVSNVYLRNAALPMLAGGFQWPFGKSLVGGGLEYMTLQPAETNRFAGVAAPIKIDDRISGFSGVIYGKWTTSAFTLKASAAYAENGYHLVMLGGYAVKELRSDGTVAYTPVRASAGWVDLSANKTRVQPAVFVAIARNHGAPDIVEEAPGKGRLVYARGIDIKAVGQDVDYVWRIAPRLAFNSGKARLAWEVEYTAAAYGEVDEHLRVPDSETVSNLRLQFSAFYFF